MAKVRTNVYKCLCRDGIIYEIQTILQQRGTTERWPLRTFTRHAQFCRICLCWLPRKCQVVYRSFNNFSWNLGEPLNQEQWFIFFGIMMMWWLDGAKGSRALDLRSTGRGFVDTAWWMIYSHLRADCQVHRDQLRAQRSVTRSMRSLYLLW